MKKLLANPVLFVMAYLVFMIATYLLPYGGSNSVLIQSGVRGTNYPGQSHFHTLFWMHFGSLATLVVLTWIRGSFVGKNWIVIFPILAGVFDLVPGLSLIPFIPTFMHLCALIMGARGGSQEALISQLNEPTKFSVNLPPTSHQGQQGSSPVNFGEKPVPSIAAFCTECGSTVTPNSKFCGECGKVL